MSGLRDRGIPVLLHTLIGRLIVRIYRAYLETMNCCIVSEHCWNELINRVEIREISRQTNKSLTVKRDTNRWRDRQTTWTDTWTERRRNEQLADGRTDRQTDRHTHSRIQTDELQTRI